MGQEIIINCTWFSHQSATIKASLQQMAHRRLIRWSNERYQPVPQDSLRLVLSEFHKTRLEDEITAALHGRTKIQLICLIQLMTGNHWVAAVVDLDAKLLFYGDLLRYPTQVT
jgi:hypothetical protein